MRREWVARAVVGFFGITKAMDPGSLNDVNCQLADYPVVFVVVTNRPGHAGLQCASWSL